MGMARTDRYQRRFQHTTSLLLGTTRTLKYVLNTWGGTSVQGARTSYLDGARLDLDWNLREKHEVHACAFAVPERNDRSWEGLFKEGLRYAVVVEYEENMRTRYKYPIWRIERRLLKRWHFGIILVFKMEDEDLEEMRALRGRCVVVRILDLWFLFFQKRSQSSHKKSARCATP